MFAYLLLNCFYAFNTGSTDKAAMIVSQPLIFLPFRGNDFQKQITYSLNFKISPRHENRSTYMVLITDKCIGNPGGQKKSRKPSISLAFQPNTKTFHLQFRTKSTAVDEQVKGARPVSIIEKWKDSNKTL